MGRIAVSVVLLPPLDINEFAIELNQQLKHNPSRPPLRLSLKDYLPHITLTLGTIKEDKIAEAKKTLKETLSEYSPLDLEIKSIYTIDVSQLIGLEIKKTNQLQSLHEDISKAMKPYFTHQDVHEEMFLGDKIDDDVPYWVENFPLNKSYNKFHPHITLGCGTIDITVSDPLEFIVNRVALTRIGNHCTVRDILEEYRLA